MQLILHDYLQATEYILVLSGFAIDYENYPSPDFVNWLISCGAVDGLEKWKHFIGNSALTGQVCYCFIGRKGQYKRAIEEYKFSMTGVWREPPESVNASTLAFLYEKPQAKDVQEILKAPEGYRAL